MTASTTAPDRAEISRQNGRRSKGPKSAAGKSKSRLNALKHGLTARLAVLPGEDQDEFGRHVSSFLEALEPRDAVELALAEQAALAVWKIRRAERAESARVQIFAAKADPSTADDLIAGTGLEEASQAG